MRICDFVPSGVRPVGLMQVRFAVILLSITGYGEALTRINGRLVKPTLYAGRTQSRFRAPPRMSLRAKRSNL